MVWWINIVNFGDLGMRFREIVEGRSDPLDNPAFRSWFGDSQVVDSSGKPLVVYHGTTGDYTSLKLSSEGALGAGIYLTPNAEFAGNYASGSGANIIPVYVSMQNPLIIDGGRDDPMIYALVKLGVDRDRAVRMVERAYDEHGYIRRQVMSRALAAGHDGLIQYRDGRVAEIVAYNPSQVKSAVGNSGRYSPGDRSMVGEGGIRRTRVDVDGPPPEPDYSDSSPDRVGSGLFYTAKEKPEGDIELGKYSPVASDRYKDDAKVVWIRAMERLMKQGNPYVPRVYEMSTDRYRDADGKLKVVPKFSMERLFKISDLNKTSYTSRTDDEVFYKNFMGMVGQVSNALRISFEDSFRQSDYNPYNLWQAFVEHLAIIIKGGDESTYYDLDPKFMDVVKVLRRVKEKAGLYRGFDLHTGNFMVRASQYGWNVVVTDPFV